jgi:hypothetical protein
VKHFETGMPYSQLVRGVCMICALLAAAPDVRAGGLIVSPRTIGRAGTGTVVDDGCGALQVNPAALARREGKRAQVGVAFVDDEIAWQSDTSGAPVARDQASSSIAPFGAGIGSSGPWVIALGAMTSGVSNRSLRRPGDLPPDQLGVAFDFRYMGIAGAMRRDTVALAVARRIGDQLALGVSLATSRIGVTEVRRMWAGFDGRDTVGDPTLDVELALAGSDRFVPSVVTGILFAPADAQLELGASLTLSANAHVAADVSGTTTGSGPRLMDTGAHARLDVAQPWIARGGARYLGKRFVLELGGEVATVPDSAIDATWRVADMMVVDSSGLTVPLTRVPSRISERTSGAFRTALDVELIAGFLWATGGYAYSIGNVSSNRQSPIFGDLGGHTFAAGLEGSTGGVMFTVGWSRTWSITTHTDSDLHLDNPFEAGDKRVASGSYDGSVDQIGILLDVELDAPK